MEIPKNQPLPPLVEMTSGQDDRELADNLFTPATLGMTVPRMALGAIIPIEAARGKNTTLHTFVAALSDGEGFVARFIDKHFPNSNLGSTIQGKDLDPKADFAFLFGSNLAAMLAKSSHPASRLAGVLVLTKLSLQADWAIHAGLEYKAATGESLSVDVKRTGKLATAVTLASEAASTISRDITPNSQTERRWRNGLAWASLALAGAGLVLGEKAKDENDIQFRQKLAAHTDQANT